MNSLIINKLSIIIGTIGLIIAGSPMNAQTKVVNHDFSVFTGIDVQDDFEVSISNSDNYSIRLTVSEALTDYIQTYVKAQTLHIFLDTKSIPSDVKKMFKGKNAIKPVLKAVIFMPTINKINMSDNSSINSTTPFETATSFSLNMSGKTMISNLNIKANSADITMSKNSNADITVSADNITASTSGSSNLKLAKSGKELTLDPSGSSIINVSGNNSKVVVKSSGPSKVSIIGSTTDLSVSGSGSGIIDALGLVTSTASIGVKGSASVTESATDTLTLDISDGCKVIFTGDPKVVITNIKNSSVSRYGVK